MTTEIVKGSLSAIARENNKSLAESWISVDAVILVDISFSMSEGDARNGMTRHRAAQEELDHLQKTLPGKLAIVAFSEGCTFMPGGVLPPAQGATDMAKALKYVRLADKIPGIRFIVISDGEPQEEDAALIEARKFKNRIDTVYIGPELGSGRVFLQKLDNLKNGQAMTKPQLKELATGIFGLLEA